LWDSETYDGDGSTVLIYPSPELIKEAINNYTKLYHAQQCAKCKGKERIDWQVPDTENREEK